MGIFTVFFKKIKYDNVAVLNHFKIRLSSSFSLYISTRKWACSLVAKFQLFPFLLQRKK
jgi:hypothetical protein